MKSFVKRARLPRAAYDENRDLGEVLSRYAKKEHPITHSLSCRCRSCYNNEDNT